MGDFVLHLMARRPIFLLMLVAGGGAVGRKEALRQCAPAQEINTGQGRWHDNHQVDRFIPPVLIPVALWRVTVTSPRLALNTSFSPILGSRRHNAVATGPCCLSGGGKPYLPAGSDAAAFYR